MWISRYFSPKSLAVGRNPRQDDGQILARYKNAGERFLIRKRKMRGSLVSVGVFFCLCSSALSEAQERFGYRLRPKEKITFLPSGPEEYSM